MNPLDERELDRLRVDLESDRIERKQSAADRSKLRRNICALANDLPGHGLPGVIFIGVENDGQVRHRLRHHALARSSGSLRWEESVGWQ